MAVGARSVGRDRPPRVSRAVRRPSERFVLGLAGFVIVLVAWEAVVQAGLVRRALLSSPSAIAQMAVRDFGSGLLWNHIGTSLTEFVLGFGAALVTGIALGVALGLNRRVHAFIDPWLSAIYATPTIALLPIIVMIFGIGLESKVIVVWLEAFIVVTVSTMSGVAASERRHLEVAYSFGASRWLTFRSVVLPSALPFSLTGIRLGVGRGLVGVVVAELLASNAGIGYYIALSGAILNTSGVMLGIVLIGLFGLVVGELLRRVEMRFEPWRPTSR